MTKPSAAARVPRADVAARERVLELVAEHLKRKYEPLHLALQFTHPRHRRDICLFEVLGGFGDGQIDPKRKIFEMEFASNPNFPMPEERNLRLFLTSPEELREAVQKGWTSLLPLLRAAKAGEVDVLFKDKVGASLLRLLG